MSARRWALQSLTGELRCHERDVIESWSVTIWTDPHIASTIAVSLFRSWPVFHSKMARRSCSHAARKRLVVHALVNGEPVHQACHWEQPREPGLTRDPLDAAGALPVVPVLTVINRELPSSAFLTGVVLVDRSGIPAATHHDDHTWSSWVSCNAKSKNA